MSGNPRMRRVLLFALPLAAYAALLAGADGAESPLAAAMPRVLIGSAIAVGVAWLASGIDNDRGGRWSVIVGLAMAMCASGSIAFGLSLAVALLMSGGSAFTLFALAFFAAMIGMVLLIIIHVIDTCLQVGMRAAALATAVHAVVLTTLILTNERAAAATVSAACVVGGTTMLAVEGAFGRRAEKKSRP